VVVHEFNVFGVGTGPAKADAELIIHADAPLPCAISLQLLTPVRWRCTEIVDLSSQVELLQLAQRRTFNIHESSDASQLEQGLCINTLESLDRHGALITLRVTKIKRERAFEQFYEY
jgi:hypothetical protein